MKIKIKAIALMLFVQMLNSSSMANKKLLLKKEPRQESLIVISEPWNNKDVMDNLVININPAVHKVVHLTHHNKNDIIANIAYYPNVTFVTTLVNYVIVNDIVSLFDKHLSTADPSKNKVNLRGKKINFAVIDKTLNDIAAKIWYKKTSSFSTKSLIQQLNYGYLSFINEVTGEKSDIMPISIQPELINSAQWYLVTAEFDKFINTNLKKK